MSENSNRVFTLDLLSKKEAKRQLTCLSFLPFQLRSVQMLEEQNNFIGYSGKNLILHRTEGKSKLQIWSEASRKLSNCQGEAESWSRSAFMAKISVKPY